MFWIASGQMPSDGPQMRNENMFWIHVGIGLGVLLDCSMVSMTWVFSMICKFTSIDPFFVVLVDVFKVYLWCPMIFILLSCPPCLLPSYLPSSIPALPRSFLGSFPDQIESRTKWASMKYVLYCFIT